jgi:hypothetical protein
MYAARQFAARHARFFERFYLAFTRAGRNAAHCSSRDQELVAEASRR